MSDSEVTAPLSANEAIKARSNYLRGTIAEGLRDLVTGAISEDDAQLTKFHGTYQQDDRDLRQERLQQRLEPLYSFMIRVRVPGGIVQPRQWLALDELAHSHANGTLRLTTRQAIQFHGVSKRNLRDTIYQINQTLLDTIAACGDVNRNVMCNVTPELSGVHAAVFAQANALNRHLTPRTTAYPEIWLGKQLLSGGEQDEEPIYGKTYLPRKFKIALAVPPSNDVDVFANDLGFIAIVENDGLLGYNVVVGGGMGRTHGDDATYPRLADLLGFCSPDQVLAVAEETVKIQRDFGDRGNRRHARFKYTIADRGLEWFRGELHRRLGFALAPARPYHFTGSGDSNGWVRGQDGLWYYGLFVENGRVADLPDYPLMSGLRRIAAIHDGDFRVTGNQNLVIAGVSEAKRPAVQALLAEFGLGAAEQQTPLRRASMACVALPTCALAMAESERYLPSLIEKLDVIMADAGLAEQAIIVRMTGCPNGCGRPYLGEIGLVGKSPGHYQLWLGASANGDRLAQLYRESLDEQGLLQELTPMIQRYARERKGAESFGDFVARAGYVDSSLAFEI